MRAALTCLFALSLAVPLFAQTNQVSIEVLTYPSFTPLEGRVVPIHTRVTYEVRLFTAGLITHDTEVVLDVPGTVRNLLVPPFIGCSDPNTRPIRCTIAVPDAFHLDTTIGVSTTLDTVGTHTATFQTGSRSVKSVFEVVDQPSLRAGAQKATIYRIAPGQTVQYKSFLTSDGGTATNVQLRHTLPQGGTFIAARPSDPETQCTVTPQEVVCTRATVPHGLAIITELDVIAPDRLTGGTVQLRVEVTKNEQDADPRDDVFVLTSTLLRHLVVSNTNDEGSGSLRQALLESHLSCANEPCAIVFRIPGTPADGAFEIRPRSELPVVRGLVTIDGATQQNGRIVLDGAEAGAAHGLVIGPGCEIQILDLTITGFTWPGIQAQTLPYAPCEGDFPVVHPGVLIARNTITNNYRGVMVVDSAEIAIRGNTITGNRRSGIFAERTGFVEVTNNRIEANGASGIFLDTGKRNRLVYTSGGAVVTDNVIANHPQWGITRTNNGEVQIQRNSIYGNRHPAIDLELDFETPNRPVDDYFTIPNKPVLLSAAYDAVQQATVVTFHLDHTPGHPVYIDFYANDPAGIAPQWQMQEWAGTFDVPATAGTNATIAIPRDLRGKLLVATTSRGRFTSFAKPPRVTSDSHTLYTRFDTSEPSNAVPVQ